MDLKKVILVTGILAAVSMASVLETNDVKMNTLLGLGGNPAVIAVNKKVNFEVGTVAINKNKQNAKLLNGASTHDGKNENDMTFADASRFFWFAGNIGEDWFGIRHTNVSNVYPFATAKLDVDTTNASKVTMFRKDTVETFSLLWARELTKGYSAGIELATNTYTLNDNTLYNTAAEKLPLGPFTPVDSSAFSISKPYYSLTLGLVKELDAANKISFAHKLSQDKSIYYNNDAGKTYTYKEALPNESALSYIYKVNESWEVAGTYKAFWAVAYTSDKPGETTVTKYPYSSIGFATDYKMNDKWAFQGYGTFFRNYKKVERGESNPSGTDVMDRGFNVTQLGGNIQYRLNVIKGGTILLGSYVTKLQSEDASVGYLFDITNTTLSYSQNF